MFPGKLQYWPVKAIVEPPTPVVFGLAQHLGLVDVTGNDTDPDNELEDLTVVVTSDSHYGVTIEMAEDGGADAVSFAFAGIVRNQQEVWTMGMHVMGLPEVLMRRSDCDADGDAIIEVIRYLCRGDKPIRSKPKLARPIIQNISNKCRMTA